MKNIVLMFFVWLFGKRRQNSETWVFFMKFALGIFFPGSVVIKDFLSSWHRYWFVYPKGFDPN